MNKKGLNWVIVLLLVLCIGVTITCTALILRALNENRVGDMASDDGGNSYSPEKILSGNFEEFAGDYYCGDSKQTLLPGGYHCFDGETYDDSRTVRNIRQNADGSYTWVNAFEVYDEYSGEYWEDAYWIRLYPVGVEILSYDGGIVPSDTSRVRLVSGNGDVTPDIEIYYKE